MASLGPNELKHNMSRWHANFFEWRQEKQDTRHLNRLGHPLDMFHFIIMSHYLENVLTRNISNDIFGGMMAALSVSVCLDDWDSEGDWEALYVSVRVITPDDVDGLGESTDAGEFVAGMVIKFSWNRSLRRT